MNRIVVSCPSEMFETTSIQEYNELSTELKSGYYWRTNYDDDGKLLNYYKARPALKTLEEKTARLEFIRNTPDITISVTEYNELPHDIKQSITWSRIELPVYNYDERDYDYEYIGYTKKKETDEQKTFKKRMAK